jgi:hypothetical protein
VSPSNVALVDKGIVNEFVQMLIGIVRSSGKLWYQGWLEAGEPSVDSCHKDEAMKASSKACQKRHPCSKHHASGNDTTNNDGSGNPHGDGIKVIKIND